MRRSNTDFLRVVSPLFVFVKLLILSTPHVDLEKMGICFAFD